MKIKITTVIELESKWIPKVSLPLIASIPQPLNVYILWVGNAKMPNNKQFTIHNSQYTLTPNNHSKWY